MKKYLINNEVYSFDVLETYNLCGEYLGDICYYAKCLQNNKFAWIDKENGIQFEGEKRIIAEPYIKAILRIKKELEELENWMPKFNSEEYDAGNDRYFYELEFKHERIKELKKMLTKMEN